MKAKISLLLFMMLITLLVFLSLQFVPTGYAFPGVTSYYPSGYNLLGSTTYISGSLSDLQSNNEVYMTFRSYPSAFSTTTNTRAFIGYRSNTSTSLLSSPKGRAWNGTTWDVSETELPTAGSPVRFVRVAYSPLAQYYDYKIAVVLSDDGTLDAYVYNGTSWSVTNNLADLWTTAPTGAQRPYDIAFETSSGNALLVYGWFDDTTNDLAYRRWFANNQTWSAQILLDDPTEATEVDYSFVILDNDKTSGSNYIGLIALVTTTSDSLTAIWNGSNWGNMTDLSTGVSIATEEDIGVVWAYDGSLMAVSGEGANEIIRWNRWTKTGGWGTSSTFDMDTAQTLVTNWITIKADPVTDDLMLTMVDSGSDLHTGYWNGATWSITSNIDTAVDTNSRRPVDFEWEPTGSKGLLVRGTNSGQITWRTWTTGTGWGTDNNPSMGAYGHFWVQLRRNPRNVAGDIKILGAVAETTANDLGAIKWDGTTFTVIGASTFTADTTVTTYECFDIEFQNFGDPTEFVSEVEFTGASDTQSWTKLVWTVDSAWTAASVNITIQLYNYQQGQYPTSGDGYASYISSGTPDTDETKNQTITTNPTYFRDGLGNWKLKVKGVKATPPRFNFKGDLIKIETSVADTTPPVWSNAGTNNTIAGQPTLFYVKWTDNIGLSGFIFGTNNTGTWSNDTWTPMSGTTNWSNITKILNSTASLVQWRVWANDTSNNWNDTGILSLTLLKLPVASFTYSPLTPDTGETVTFNASASYDPDGTIVSYFWTFGDGTNSTGAITTHAYADNGVYTITLKVTDNSGLTDTEIKSITVFNRPPIASFTESATSAPTGTPIYFNASASYDPDGTIVSYFWTFGDGTNATGITVSHAYADNGTYTVVLKVTDNDGASATATAIKTVLNRLPVASFTESATTVYRGEVIHFNASASYDPDGSIISYFWAFGDGTNATGMVVDHAYTDLGTYIVILTVTDNDGATGTANATKTVVNRPPVAAFTESATTAYTGEIIYFNASSSYDFDGSIVSYFWAFGDGTNATGVIVTHAYGDNGNYVVTLTVTDDDSATASATATKTVLNRPPVALFTESATMVYTGEVIYFNASASYDPDGVIASYFWNFGDGTNATGVVVSHAYSDNGVYTVTLIVTDNDGATATTTATKTVLNRPPVAIFTESAETVYIGQSITFNASNSYDPDGTIASYFWNFGDGTNATGAIASHAYSVNGTFTVTLTVTDNDGASSSTSATKTVLWNEPPVASFTESAEIVYTSDVITFNASTSYDPDGSIVSYFWTFGDGTNATGVIVTHAYIDDGVYAVTLTVTDNVGATDSATATKTVLNRLPVASFIESAETVLTGEIIYFNASASYDPDGAIISYFWDFGDGTNASGVTVSHAYTDSGTYTVTLIVTDSDNATATTTATKTILNRPPVASFTESAETVYTDDVIMFNASTSFDPDGTIVSYTWNFGDGNITTMTTPIITHTYADNGTYTVTLTVADNDGATASTSSTKMVLNRPPIAVFTYLPSAPYTGQIVTFNATASYDPDGSVVGYTWNFGDGNITTVLNPIVAHAYADNGTYTVTLTVTDNDGAIGVTSASITVLNRPPVASFTESATTVFTGEVISFNASASYDPDGSIVSYFWFFGDGSNATGLTVEHTYAEDGNYTVILTVTDDDGATDTTSSTKMVLNRAPVASFTESAETVYPGETIHFNASSSYDPDGTIVSYFWNFGDGTNTTGIIATHAYADNGTYTVTLTVTDDDGATDSVSAVKTVQNRAPVANFTESAKTVYTGEVITFNASNSYDADGAIVSYFWTFGDGTNATGILVDHAYADDGTYVVTLTVTDDDGASASISAIKTVLNRPPIAMFTESAETVVVGQPIYFNASQSYDPDGSIVSYYWDFGDGTNATGATVQHAYADSGTYIVTLTVTDNDGTTASASAEKFVAITPPVAIFTESAETVLTGETITFDASGSYDPDGTIVSYFWDFGDGTNSTGIVIGHSYADDGNYTVILTVTDDDGATDTATSTKTVLNRPPVAKIKQSATVVYTSQVIHFNASESVDSDGIIVSYFWNFGDGTNATGIKVDHAFEDDGYYTVSLVVTDDDGATGKATSTTRVLNRAPVASFAESAKTVYTNEAITFNATDSYDLDGSIVSYFWNFGDGTNATGVIVAHAYSDDGNYTVTLTVIDDDGATDSESATKTVLNRAPVASFAESAETVLVGETIYFNASNSYDSDGSIVSYFWNFGDGTNATGATPEHAYADVGVYTVTLTVTDDDGATASTSSTKAVGVTPPVAIFTESAETVYTNEIITFNASGSYDPDGYVVSYFWNFGDGTNATGIIANHAYADNGTYTVTLTITDDDGATDTATSTKTVLNRAPVAIFAESATTVLTGEVIYFNASNSHDSDGSIVSYLWDFGDGTNATGATVEHAYADDGNYTVTLTVTDDDGATASTSTTKTVLNRAPVAIFSESAETVITDEVIYFNASGSYDPDGSIVSYFWNFGDGTNTTGVTAEHSYTLEGTYAVTLTVTDNEGAKASTTATKTVRQKPPVAVFSESAETVYTSEVISLNASASYDPDGYIVNYFWDFGDGTNATGMIVDHAYADNGTYAVTLIVTDDDGATDTATSTKTVLNRPPVANFTKSATTVLTKVIITFNASDSYDLDGVISYFWNFGDGASATGVVVRHAYADDGNYTVTLTVTDDDGATDTATSTVTILNRPPVALFTESAEIVLVGEDILFNAWAVSYDPDGLIVRYFWDFGDGTNALAVTVLHAYENSGNYTVTLFVTDDDGATDTAAANKTVYYRYPHDIAVANVTSSETEVYAGQIVNITVVVRNEGTETETFNVTAYYGNNVIGTQTVTDLPSGENITLTFIWNTTGVQPSINYTIKAEASVVPGEVDTSDNTYSDGATLVKGVGDVNGDGKVNIIDIVIVALAFDSRPGDPDWNPIADLNRDDIVNIIDIVMVALHWEEEY